MDENVKMLLQHLKQTEVIATMPHNPTITEEEQYKGKLKVWRESTATLPSGLHLGHYKALITKHSFSNVPEDKDEDHKRQREEIDNMQAELLQVHLGLLNYALKRGYSYTRWQKIANTILFKEPGNIKFFGLELSTCTKRIITWLSD